MAARPAPSELMLPSSIEPAAMQSSLEFAVLWNCAEVCCHLLAATAAIFSGAEARGAPSAPRPEMPRSPGRVTPHRPRRHALHCYTGPGATRCIAAPWPPLPPAVQHGGKRWARRHAKSTGEKRKKEKEEERDEEK